MLTLLAATLPLLQAPQAVEPARFPDFPDQDALSYGIDVKLDLAKRRVDGTVRYAIRALRSLRKVQFHARRSDAYRVEFFADRNGKPLPAEWKESDRVVVTLPKPAAKNDVVRLWSKIAGTPVAGLYFKKNRYGQMMAFTDHYSIRARGWLPCEDHPADRATWSVRVFYPKGNQAAAFGTFQEGFGHGLVPDGYDDLITESNTEIPPYMFAMVVGPFARVKETGDPRIWPHFVYENDVAKAKPILVHHAKWIAAMEKAFGPYPYKTYTTAQCPTRWGGFEAPELVQLSERIYDRKGVGTLAHELVHMWFGDSVGYARWREVWLSEGFASYFGPWLHAKAGGPRLRESMAGMRDRWRKSFEGRTKTIRDDSFPHPDRALNSNTYPKGAWVLHMLRGELGDDVFFKALGTYYKRFAGQSVVTKDFVAVVEEVSKQKLGWFFEQWLDRVDCPHLEVRGEEGKLVVRQVQKGKPYRFWLKLGWRQQGGPIRTKRVRIEKRETVVDEPRVGMIDPFVELLFREK